MVTTPSAPRTGGSNVVTNIPPGFSIPPNYISSQETATKSELETTTTMQTMYTQTVQTYTTPQLNPATIGGSTTTNSIHYTLSNQAIPNTTSGKYS